MTNCPEGLLSEAAQIAGTDQKQGLTRVDALLEDYGQDGRLHFLRGSLLASLKDYGEARKAMATAVMMAPEFYLARFQLGFLELTSGHAAEAEAAWAPLDTMPIDSPYRLFARGLRHMMADEFKPAIILLQQGIALNSENPPLNADMQLLVQEMLAKQDLLVDSEMTSSAQILLQQFSRTPTKH